ncbi:hypothetical protein HHS_01600 [Candidatus Pantoea carbekii]|uniref:Uncharacterized protein n=1 Tax=Candidatus Pantoea carbekii TaxID=1235990 RepID=U3U5L0_9GAMM|nr:hypothetical protein HHS_01600 [Candidatus Pantoea carbekii]
MKLKNYQYLKFIKLNLIFLKQYLLLNKLKKHSLYYRTIQVTQKTITINLLK